MAMSLGDSAVKRAAIDLDRHRLLGSFASEPMPPGAIRYTLVPEISGLLALGRP